MSDIETLTTATETLAELGPKGAIDYLYGAAMESGGFLDLPRPGDDRDAQVYEVRAHGIFARAETPEELRISWCRAASAEIEALHDLALAEALVMVAGPAMADEQTIEAAKLVSALARTRSAALAKAEHILLNAREAESAALLSFGQP